MKVIVNLVIVSIIIGGGYYFYKMNADQLDETLENVKNVSVGTVTEGLIEKAQTMDTNELIELAAENKELIVELMDENGIKLENFDMDKLKATLEETGISLENIDINDPEIKKKLAEVIAKEK